MLQGKIQKMNLLASRKYNR